MPLLRAKKMTASLPLRHTKPKDLPTLHDFRKRLLPRASSNDLYIVQQLINDSVSLLVYSESGGEEDGDESDGSSRGGGGQGGDGGRASGAGRRRSRGEALGSQGAFCRMF